MSSPVLNLNVGVLGHVDSGKTSLAKVLSAVASTASFDKNPQSQERGITIDLGFSSFSVPFPDHLKTSDNVYETLQFTLVDCPGHASLIRTIIGGAQIIDLMLLVVDATKGIQTQTAECLVIGEITCDHLLIVLNKIDLLPEEKRQILINKMMKRISKTLENTKFSGAQMVPVAANPSGNSDMAKEEPIGIETLIKTLTTLSYIPYRSCNGPFIFVVDHCFAIKGQGSVMTGTAVQGCISVSESIEIPTAKLTRKVKSIQMFKNPIEKAVQGDRVGICVTQFDSKLLERGVACAPGHMQYVDAVIAEVEKISYFKGSCTSSSKFHITIMHETVIAKCSFFGKMPSHSTIESTDSLSKTSSFSFDNEYTFLKELMGTHEKGTLDSDLVPEKQFTLLEFDKPVIVSKEAILIGSKLDMDIHSNVCRLAFHGKAKMMFFSKQQLTAELPNLKVYKVKHKEGVVERMVNEHEVICKDLFKKETKIQLFINLKVKLSTGENGIIEGSFGQSGKVKVRIPNGLTLESIQHIGKKKGRKGDTDTTSSIDTIKIFLKFKRYIYDEKKKIIQT